jgi:tetratricopeptide (TPR) repeat protein
MKNIDMKNIISIIALVSILMVSCREDFIEILPESTVTVEKVYKTDKDFNDAIIGVYNGLQEPYEDFWEFGDLRGDDTEQDAERQVERVRVDDFAMDVNADLLNNSWRDYYDIIFRINTLLSYLEEADASIIPNKELYIGEAKFLRALAYFDLVRIFGDVPMLTTPISVEEAYQTGRENVDIVYDEIIIKDLLEAENNLPLPEQTDVGRANQGAAKALLGKVYLTRKDFTKAEAKLQEVTTMGYGLLPNYGDLFDYGVEHHSEYIFDIQYIDGGFGLGSPFTTTFNVETQDVGTDLVNAIKRVYNIESPQSGGAGTPSEALMAAFDPQDLRKYITVATGIYVENGDFVPIAGPGQVNTITQKYMTSQTINGDSKANWKMIRYADVLLMLAEALNENGKTAEALTYLNQVRERAGLEGYSNLTQAEAREKIYQERRFELYLEGHRWFDLVRTGRALEVMEPYGMQPHMTVFPIPQSQIEVVNDPSIFSQNPGY